MFGTGDAGKNANNQRVSLFRIRNAFQEARVGKNQLLIRENLSLEIADGVCDIVDFWCFINNNLTITADNIAQAEKIADFINGGLFDDIDALWITEKRERVSTQIEEVLVAMSIFYLSGGFKEQAEAALLRLLSLNPVSEQGYRRLLDLYMQTDDHLKYLCYYERNREMTKKFCELPPEIYTHFYKNARPFSPEKSKTHSFARLFLREGAWRFCNGLVMRIW